MSSPTAPARANGLPLVVLHGMFGDRDNLRGLARSLGEDIEPTRDGERGAGPSGTGARGVLRLDLPGHGAAAATDPLSIDAMADAIARDIAAAGIERCHLLGHSLGGKVAMTLAGRAPGTGAPDAAIPPVASPDIASSDIASLIVIDIAPRENPPHHRSIIEALLGLDLAAHPDRRSADAALAAGVPDPRVRAFLLKAFARDGDGARWRFDLEAIERDYDRLRAAPPDAGRVFESPALFVAGGANDYLCTTDEPLLRTRFADPRLHVVAGAGHWVHAEKPAEVAALCSSFLDEVEAGGAAPADRAEP